MKNFPFFVAEQFSKYFFFLFFVTSRNFQNPAEKLEAHDDHTFLLVDGDDDEDENTTFQKQQIEYDDEEEIIERERRLEKCRRYIILKKSLSSSSSSTQKSRRSKQKSHPIWMKNFLSPKSKIRKVKSVTAPTQSEYHPINYNIFPNTHRSYCSGFL